MLFAAGVPVPPGTRSLGDFIDENDPCTLNPSDSVCQQLATTVANDPCKINPNDPICQQAIVENNSAVGRIGDALKNAFSWLTGDSGIPSDWATKCARIVRSIDGSSFECVDVSGNVITTVPTQTPSINANAHTTPMPSASLARLPWKPILIVLTVAGGAFALWKWKSKSKTIQV